MKGLLHTFLCISIPTFLAHIAIVLVHPKFPENIGAAARIAWNMGITRLIVVSETMPEYEAMARMATHKAVHLIDRMEVHPRLQDALAPFTIVIGTTARRGRQRILEKTPRDIVAEILPQIASNQIAILFGPENCGLSNDELKYCQMTSAIPTADFSSLNLAQAVAIHCYELYYGIIHAQKDMHPVPQICFFLRTGRDVQPYRGSPPENQFSARKKSYLLDEQYPPIPQPHPFVLKGHQYHQGNMQTISLVSVLFCR